MKTKVNQTTWPRRHQFNFFKDFDEPFWGATVEVDCTLAYQAAKETGRSFYLHYLYQSLRAVNAIENFRYRMEEDAVFLYDRVGASATVSRENGTFGFSYVDYQKTFEEFEKMATVEFERVRASEELVPGSASANVIHYSSLPWLHFTGLSHARNFQRLDTAPKISFGKMTESAAKKTMPVSIHVHHALVDGLHVGQHVEAFQTFLNEKI